MKHINEYINNEEPINEVLGICLAIVGTILFTKTASAALNVTGEMVEDFWDWTFNGGEHKHTLHGSGSAIKRTFI